MRYYLIATLFLAGCLISSGEYSERELKRIQRAVDIGGVSDDTWKNDDRERFEELEINTFQDIEYTSGFRIRLAVELTDKEKNRYIVKFTGDGPDGYDSEYQGEDFWLLRMAHGDLQRLKISGYAVQYGIMDGETFIPLAEEYDDVETFEELTERDAIAFTNTVRLLHYYMYDDLTEGYMESSPRRVRAVRE
jgi:hypothetical protein